MQKILQSIKNILKKHSWINLSQKCYFNFRKFQPDQDLLTNVVGENINSVNKIFDEKVCKKSGVLTYSMGQIFTLDSNEELEITELSENNIYFVLNGATTLKTKDEAEQDRVINLDVGGCFCGRGIFESDSFWCVGKSNNSVTIFCLDLTDDHVKKVLGNGLMQYIEAVRFLFKLKHIGIIDLYFDSLFESAAISSRFHLSDSRTIIVTQAIGKRISSLIRNDIKGDQIISYQAGTESRKLTISNGKIGSISSVGSWDQYPMICELILKDFSFSENDYSHFKKSGRFENKKINARNLDSEDDDFICQCQKVLRSRVCEIVNTGALNVEAITFQTGAGSVCGTCRPLIQDILNNNAWTSVDLISVFQHSVNIFSLRFKKEGKNTVSYRPGQFICVRAKIDDSNIVRSYTLTSLFDSDNFYEITVKRKMPLGIMSNWIIDNLKIGENILVSQPMGNFTVESPQDVPLVCFVAGIGITPVIAFIRSAVEKKSERMFHIDYSNRSNSDFIFRKELKDSSIRLKSLTVNFRDTTTKKRIQSNEIKNLVEKYKAAEFFICGSEGFVISVHAELIALGVTTSAIKIEKFVLR